MLPVYDTGALKLYDKRNLLAIGLYPSVGLFYIKQRFALSTWLNRVEQLRYVL